MLTTAYRMTTTAYRDPLERARDTLAELTESLVRTLPAARTRQRILVRRRARVVFGGVAIAGSLLLVALAILRLSLTEVLLGTWLAAGGAYAVARLVGTFAGRPKNPTWTGSLFDDIRRFAAAQARRRDGRSLGALSLILPAVAISLLTPLTLHLGFWALFSEGKTYELVIHGFDEWIVLSMLIVGHAHLFLAVLAGRYASRVARLPLDELAIAECHGFKALLWTVVVSAVPGILCFAIPPLLVAVTGLAFIPFLWMALRRIALNERIALRDAGIEVV